MALSKKDDVLRVICHFIYELLLLLGLCLIALAPFHAAATQHYNITKVYSPSTVSFVTGPANGIALGDRLPVYRFHSKTKSEIGKITVSEIRGAEIICALDPKTFRFPMGRHGRVVGIDGEEVILNIGSNLDLGQGSVLGLFKERKRVGTVQLTETFPEFSKARILENLSGNPEGFTVSEFTVATQAVLFKNPSLAFVEIIFFLSVLAAHVYFFIFRKKSLFSLLGSGLKNLSGKFSPGFFTLTIGILLWIPFVWFTVTFSVLTVSYLFSSLMNLVRQIFHLAVPAAGYTPQTPANILLALYGLVSAAYFYILVRQKRSPILVFWNQVAFRNNDWPWLKGIARDIVIWLLHLTIAYAFASALFGFLSANINTMLKLAWSEIPFGITGSLNLLRPRETFQWFTTLIGVLYHMLTHMPHLKTAEDFFPLMRYFLWSLAIVGCLIGYGHSVFGYLWGNRIRNLDYTVMGWITNAWCYGPLLGVVLWTMIPSFVGPDPALTGGPLFYLSAVTELLLNAVYTLTIWNLGKMFGIMTDKGVRTTAFYGVVRHPSYTLESLMFVIMNLVCLSGSEQWFASITYLFIYYVRSEREDNFMSNSNPGYLVYREQTPYKLIPGIY